MFLSAWLSQSHLFNVSDRLAKSEPLVQCFWVPGYVKATCSMFLSVWLSQSHLFNVFVSVWPCQSHLLDISECVCQQCHSHLFNAFESASLCHSHLFGVAAFVVVVVVFGFVALLCFVMLHLQPLVLCSECLTMSYPFVSSFWVPGHVIIATCLMLFSLPAHAIATCLMLSSLPGH